MQVGQTGLNEHFGRAVALRRVRAGLTQEQLALSIGLSRASIANIEQGRQQVLLHHAVAIARTLRVGLDELTGEGTQKPEANKSQLPEGIEKSLGEWAKVVLGAKER